MKSPNTLADQGKILYLGVSDTPAWIVSKANQWARDHGLRQFVVYRGRWSAAERDFERGILPMCEAEGMGLVRWGALGSGQFKTDEQRKGQEGRMSANAPSSDSASKVTKVLEKMAAEKGTPITSVALTGVEGWHTCCTKLHIVGGRMVDHLRGNIEALSLKLSFHDIEEIEAAVPFDHGLPLGFLFMGMKNPSLKGNESWLNTMESHFEVVERPRLLS